MSNFNPDTFKKKIDVCQSSVSIGLESGCTERKKSVSIGYNCGREGQGDKSVAIGSMAGMLNQGRNSIAVGNNAGVKNQHEHTICINASTEVLNTTNEYGTFIKPIKREQTPFQLFYNPETSQISFFEVPE